jgi:hypothetical protein
MKELLRKKFLQCLRKQIFASKEVEILLRQTHFLSIVIICCEKVFPDSQLLESNVSTTMCLIRL